MSSQLPPSFGTSLLHADHVQVPDPLENASYPHPNANHPVAPGISLSTTFRSYHPHSDLARRISAADGAIDLDWQDPGFFFYSRYAQDVHLRAEKVLSKVLGGHALTYSSGLNAAYAALLHYNPSVIAIRGGYHGVHEGIKLFKRIKGEDKVQLIDLDAPYSTGGSLLVWVETPLNPIGEARDIKHYADKAHAAQGHLIVDATFAPPPLLEPFKFGTDMIMHSGTKYLNGHSDALVGVLATQSKPVWDQLWNDRTFLGSSLGSLEAWLLLRSLRTLHVRVPRQSETATKLVQWLQGLVLSAKGEQTGNEAASKVTETADHWDGAPKGIVTRVWHASLQPRTDKDEEGDDSEWGSGFDPRTQMNGWPACFAIRLSKPEYARMLPHVLEYFFPATSLGGVESLIEQRRVSDPGADPRLIRLSIGLEDPEDLIADLRTGILKVIELEKQGKLAI